MDKNKKKSDITKYIKLFNDDFKYNLAENKFPFLMKLFTEYINQEITDPKRNRIS